MGLLWVVIVFFILVFATLSVATMYAEAES